VVGMSGLAGVWRDPTVTEGELREELIDPAFERFEETDPELKADRPLVLSGLSARVSSPSSRDWSFAAPALAAAATGKRCLA
jgi:hypothetical protein